MCVRSRASSCRQRKPSMEAAEMAAPSAAIDRRDIKGKVRVRLINLPVELAGLSPPERRLRVREEVLAVLRESGAILREGVVASVVIEHSEEVVGLCPHVRCITATDVQSVGHTLYDD